MELVIGICIGSVLGIFFSLIPGFNMGFAWLAAPMLPGEPRFVVGLIIGIDPQVLNPAIKLYNLCVLPR